MVEFVARMDHKVKIKEKEKRDNYLDLAGEQKRLWNMRLSVIPIRIGALGTVHKDLVIRLKELEIGRRAEPIQTTALIRSDRILKRQSRVVKTNS